MLPVVFVPGMLCGADLWSSVQARHRCARHRCGGQRLEYRGDGRAGARERGRSLRARGPQPGCDRRVRGIVRDPQRVAGFCAISTNAGAPSVGQYQAWRAMANRTARGEFTDLVRDTILPTMFASAEPRHTVSGGSLPWRTASGPEPFARSRVDAVPSLRAVRCPTRVISGQADALCPPSFHHTIAESITGSRLEYFARSRASVHLGTAPTLWPPCSATGFPPPPQPTPPPWS